MSTELAAGLVKLTVRLVPVLLKLSVYQPFKSLRHCMGRKVESSTLGHTKGIAKLNAGKGSAVSFRAKKF